MAEPMDLEFFREILGDKRLNLALAQITKVSIAADRSVMKVLVSILPEQREIVARMTWQGVGPDAGLFLPIMVGDLVIVGMAEGDEEQVFVLSRLTSKVDKIPTQFANGHAVLKALAGKQLWVTSDTRINLSMGDVQPTENLVLGQELKTLLSTMLEKMADMADMISKITVTGNLGLPAGPPLNAAAFLLMKTELELLKASPVDDSAILSDIAFTEKG